MCAHGRPKQNKIILREQNPQMSLTEEIKLHRFTRMEKYINKHTHIDTNLIISYKN